MGWTGQEDVDRVEKEKWGLDKHPRRGSITLPPH